MEKQEPLEQSARIVEEVGERVRRARAVREKIDSAGFFDQMKATINGKARESRTEMDFATMHRETMLSAIEENIESLRSRAGEYVDEYMKTYGETWTKLCEELGTSENFEKNYWSKHPAEINYFLDNVDALSMPEEATLTDRARALAFKNVLQPVMNHADKRYGGGMIDVAGREVAFRNGSSFPRMELGTDLEIATKKASEMQTPTLLRISAWIDSGFGENTPVEKYIPLSAENAKLFELCGRDNLDRNSDLHVAFGPNQGAYTGTAHVEYELVTVQEKAEA